MSKKALSILIVEDDPIFADTLEMHVDELGYQLAGIADDAANALQLFKLKNPDLVLMDIHIKGETTGIELAKKMQLIRKLPLIFITSFDDPNIFKEARQTLPFAYLIKPIHREELERAMDLAMLHLQTNVEKDNFEKGEEAIVGEGHFFIKNKNKLVRINGEEVLWISVDDKYCMLHTLERKFMLRQSLSDLIASLDSKRFMRIHRSFVVNLKAITGIDVGQFTVFVNEDALPLGLTYKDDLLSRLKMLR